MAIRKVLAGVLVSGCVLLLLLARLESWSTATYHWGNWWGLLWPWPALCVSAFLLGSRKGVGRLLSLLPLVALVVVWWFEIAVGRTTASPWWLGHSLIAAALLCCSGLLGMRARRTSVGMAVVLFAWTLPWVSPGASQHFWYDCNRLRLGMSMEDVFGVMHEYFVWGHGDDRAVPIAVRNLNEKDGADLLLPPPVTDIDDLGLDPTREYATLTFEHGGDEADLCIAYFDGTRLARYWTWPD